MDLGLKDQVALVTAASRGLGRAAALAFAEEGAKVAISSRTDQITTTAEHIVEKTGAEVLAAKADLTDPEAIQNLVKRTLERFERIDILFINAGGPPPGLFIELTPEDWEAAINLTLMSAVHLCYSVVPHMLERGKGCILTTQSYTVKEPLDHLILSNSLRMAVIGLMKSLANEIGPKGIRVNSINPTWTWTERVESLIEDRASRSGMSVAEETSKLTQNIPLGRMGTVEEFGKAVAWLASPAASFIHGHALMFDGGIVKAAL
jgi:3-oxoacyl-[acyl-carrier protein] reductase